MRGAMQPYSQRQMVQALPLFLCKPLGIVQKTLSVECVESR